MMNTRQRVALLLTLLVLGMVACNRPADSPTPTAALTETLAPTATTAETPDATPATPQPTATSAPKPTATPKPAYDVMRYGALESLDPSGQTVIFWHPYARSREEMLNTLIAAFNRTNDWGITVIAQAHADDVALHEAVNAAIAETRAPALTLAYPEQMAAYAAQQAIIPLEPYVSSAQWGYASEELGDYFATVLASDALPQFKGRYGWPAQKSVEVLYYNRDWLKELGYTAPPETWEQFAEMACKAIRRPFSKVVGDGTPSGYVYSVDVSHFAALVFSEGGRLLDREGKQYVFHQQPGVTALTFWRDLAQRGCATATSTYGDQTDFGNGYALFTLGPAAGLSYYEKAVTEGAAFSWGAMAPPQGAENPRLNLYGASYTIFENSPEVQLAAWVFIKWLSEPEQQAQWAAQTGYFPTRASVATALSEYMAQNPNYATAFGLLKQEAGVEAPVVGYGVCREALAATLEQVLGDPALDAASALTATVATCNQSLMSPQP